MKRAVEDFASFLLTGIRNDRRVYEVTTGSVFTETGVHSLHRSDAYELNSEPGVIRWFSNDRCVPMEICENMGWGPLREQSEADRAETATFIAAYKQAQAEFDARTDPEAEAIRAEQAFELRAAHGPGAKVVDVVTGRRYRT